MFPVMQSAIPLVRTGKLRALAVTSSKRSLVLPDLPTVAEAGVDGYEFVGWQGVVVRSGTPPRVVDKLYSEIGAVLKTEEIRQIFADQGAQLVGAGPKEFAGYINLELKKWARVVAGAKLQLD
jgi:tripartite-type tricarboxylate transporter receptor subunit TctC